MGWLRAIAEVMNGKVALFPQGKEFLNDYPPLARDLEDIFSGDF